MSITRYELQTDENGSESLVEAKDGEFIDYTDHAAAIAERDHALKKMSEQYAEAVGRSEKLRTRLAVAESKAAVLVQDLEKRDAEIDRLGTRVDALDPVSVSQAEKHVADVAERFGAFGACIMALRERWDEYLRKKWGVEGGTWDVTAEATIARLTAEVERLREALEMYASEDSYKQADFEVGECLDTGAPRIVRTSLVHYDNGRTARSALAKEATDE